MIKEWLGTISGTNLFKHFTSGEISDIFINSEYTIKEYEKDQIIHIQDEQCDVLDIILSGRVAVQNIDEDGKVLTIQVFSDGDTIGANLLFSSKNYYPMTAVAISKVFILHMKREMILNICYNNMKFMESLLKEVSDRTVVLTDKINAISLKSIRQCIIDYLIGEYQIQKSNVIKLGITKKDLAERLGIQRSSLSRELSKMRRDGLIEYDASSITLKVDMR